MGHMGLVSFTTGQRESLAQHWDTQVAGNVAMNILGSIYRAGLLHEPGHSITDHFSQPMHQMACFVWLFRSILTWHSVQYNCNNTSAALPVSSTSFSAAQSLPLLDFKVHRRHRD